MTYPVKIISISINRPAGEVYQFASNPENFPKWVDFVDSINKLEDIWMAKTGMGVMKMKFTPPNDFGVIDHQVTFPDGKIVYNPMRTIANNNGCEFTFTLFRMPGKTDSEFNEDVKAVTKDLQNLKELLER
jgi:hypothetical protein